MLPGPGVHKFGLKEVENIELQVLGSCMENIRNLANSAQKFPQDGNGNVGNTDSTNNNNLPDAQRKASKSPTRLPRLNRSRSNLQRSAMIRTQCNPRSNSFVHQPEKGGLNDTAIQTSKNDIRGSTDTRKHSPSRIPVSSARSRSRSPPQSNSNDLSNPSSSALGSRSNPIPIKPYCLGSGFSSSRIPLKNSYRARTQTYVAGLRASERESNSNQNASQHQPKIPRSREETHRPTIQRENSRVQQAFLKVYDSLLSLGNSENGSGISGGTASGIGTNGNGISGGTAYGIGTNGNGISGGTAYGIGTSGNGISGGTASGIGTNGNGISGGKASGIGTNGNGISGGKAFGIETNGNGISGGTASVIGNNVNASAIPDARTSRGRLSREVSFDVALDVNPTMSKADFVKGIEDLVGELKRRSELEMRKRMEHKEAGKPVKVVPIKLVEGTSLKSTSNAPMVPPSSSSLQTPQSSSVSTPSVTNNMQRAGPTINPSTITKLFFAGTMIMLLIGIVRNES